MFNYSEDYLTARSMAVAMVVSAVALHSAGYRVLGIMTAAVAMAIHPIMAFPGLLLLGSLYLRPRTCAAAAGSACFFILALAYVATGTLAVSRYLPLMDSAWLEVVQERSQFLFLSFWRSSDWELNVRPFVSLTLTALVTADARVRKLCVNAMIIAAAGIAIAFISGSIGPVALFCARTSLAMDLAHWISRGIPIGPDAHVCLARFKMRPASGNSSGIGVGLERTSLRQFVDN